MIQISKASVVRLRMERQGFLKLLTQEELLRLFSLSSPVKTPYWCAPGQPPRLDFRSSFDSESFFYTMREERKLLKGRFQKGGIHYVLREDLSLYGCAYRKDPNALGEKELLLLDLLTQEGPMTIHLMKEYTGLLAKEITPALHKLQERFLVFEDQADNEWDRAWYLFKAEFPEVDFYRYTKISAVKEILLRFSYLHGVFTEEMARSYYQFSMKDLKTALSQLLEEKRLVSFQTDWEASVCYIAPEDLDEISYGVQLPALVLPLDRNDFLSRSYEYRFGKRWSIPGKEVVRYLLIDGEIHGAVLGHFSFSPVELYDILLDLPKEEAQRRKGEILSSIEKVYDPKESPVLHYHSAPVR
jgi:hypothetical protein